MPSDAPVERLTKNIEAYVKAHPEEANGHYTLARLHYIMFALRSAFRLYQRRQRSN